jgi:MoaA/NifB/PqqE/SkfB family radical SAM enzyme
MTIPLPVLELDRRAVPTVPFRGLSTLWVQITGTWCNLECTHCFNASGPREPWLKPLDGDTVRDTIRDAERLGVKDIYFTGGEPLLHPDIVALLDFSLAFAPTTVLTNGTAITESMADQLAALAGRARYSLEIRVSLDDVRPAANDRIRGVGSWQKAVEAITRLHTRGLLPIVTATEILAENGGGVYERFRTFLVGLGIEKPRVKILPVFAIGRQAGEAGERLTEEMLEGFDRDMLQCARTRVVADGGIYACPILAGLPGARLSTGNLDAAFRSAALYHTACVTCHQTGMTCRNA